jgi:hypothetical protein
VLESKGLSSVPVTVETPDGFYTAVLDPLNGMGREGRSDGDITGVLSGLSDAQRRAAALDQIRNMPVSDEYADVSRERLYAVLRAAVLSSEDFVSNAGPGFALCAGDDLLQALVSTLPDGEHVVAGMCAAVGRSLDKAPSLPASVVLGSDAASLEIATWFHRLVKDGMPPTKDTLKYAEAGFHSVADVQELAALGISGYTASNYRAAGAASLDEMTALYKAGVADYEAVGFAVAGVKRPADMISLNEVNVDSDDFSRYSEIARFSIPDIVKMASGSVFPSEARIFYSVGVLSPDEMVRLKSLGLSGYDVSGFGLDMPEADMVAFKSNNVSGEAYTHFRAAGVRSLEEIKPLLNRGVTGADVGNFLSRGVSDTELMCDFVAAGVSGRDLVRFHAAGVTDADEVFLHASSGLKGEQVLSYRKSGAASLDETLSLVKEGIDTAESETYMHYGAKTTSDKIALSRAGVPAQQFVMYATEDYERPYVDDFEDAPSVQQVLTLVAAGVSGHDAQEYHAADITSFDDMLALSKSGITGDDARSYFWAGADSKENMIEFKSHGISGDEAVQYHHAGFNSLESMLKVKSLGVSARDVSGYYSVGFRDLSDMLQMHSAGISGGDCGSYVWSDIEDIADMIEYHNSGVSGPEARLFKEVGATTLEQMRTFVQAGFSGGDVFGFSHMGVSTVEQMQTLRSLGLSGTDVAVYKAAGVHDVTTALMLLNGGVSSDCAEDYFWLNVTNPVEMLSLYAKGETPEVLEKKRSESIEDSK